MSKREVILVFVMLIAVGVAMAHDVVKSGPKKAAHEEIRPWLKPLVAQRQKALSEIRVEDGVDEAEAARIGHLYFVEYISGCGGPGAPELTGGKWKMQTRLGATGRQPGGVISVDPQTGGVSSSSGPAFPTFQTFATDLISGFAARRYHP